MFRTAERTFTTAERTFRNVEYRYHNAEHKTKCSLTIYVDYLSSYL